MYELWTLNSTCVICDSTGFDRAETVRIAACPSLLVFGTSAVERACPLSLLNSGAGICWQADVERRWHAVGSIDATGRCARSCRVSGQRVLPRQWSGVPWALGSWPRRSTSTRPRWFMMRDVAWSPGTDRYRTVARRGAVYISPSTWLLGDVL